MVKKVDKLVRLNLIAHINVEVIDASHDEHKTSKLSSLSLFSMLVREMWEQTLIFGSM